MVIVIRMQCGRGVCMGCHNTMASVVSGTGRYAQLMNVSTTLSQVPRPLAMKKESIQTRKRKPKMPKGKTSTGKGMKRTLKCSLKVSTFHRFN